MFTGLLSKDFKVRLGSSLWAFATEITNKNRMVSCFISLIVCGANKQKKNNYTHYKKNILLLQNIT